jgi:hypothetical protein
VIAQVTPKTHTADELLQSLAWKMNSTFLQQVYHPLMKENTSKISLSHILMGQQCSHASKMEARIV